MGQYLGGTIINSEKVSKGRIRKWLSGIVHLPYTTVANVQSDVIIPGSILAHWDYYHHLSKYVFASRFAKDKDILEVGCGTGYGASYLLNKAAGSVIAGDYAEVGLKLGAANFSKDKLAFIRLDGEQLPLATDSFDLVISFGVVDHLGNPEAYVSECWRVLRPGGLFICSATNRKLIRPFFARRPIDLWHKTEFTAEELSLLISKYYSNIEIREFHYLSKYWWQVRSIGYYTFQKLKMFNLGMKIVRLLRPRTYRLVTYSEDTVDKDFPSGIEWNLVTPGASSQAFLFMVLGTKGK
jgi:SAM-dependent methyltransferase